MITIINLSKRFGNTKVLEETSASFEQSKINFIFGPSGSGKTTLLRLIAGLEIPDDGNILISDKCVSSPVSYVKPYQRGVGYVFQTPALWPHMNVKQNIAYGLIGKFSKNMIKVKVQKTLDEFDIGGLGDRFPSELSGGQAQRVSIARSFITEPPIILLDEPLAHLDSSLKENLLEFILRYSKCPQKTIVYVTHSIVEAEKCNGLFFILDKGKLVMK